MIIAKTDLSAFQKIKLGMNKMFSSSFANASTSSNKLTTLKSDLAKIADKYRMAPENSAAQVKAELKQKLNAMEKMYQHNTAASSYGVFGDMARHGKIGDGAKNEKDLITQYKKIAGDLKAVEGLNYKMTKHTMRSYGQS